MLMNSFIFIFWLDNEFFCKECNLTILKEEINEKIEKSNELFQKGEKLINLYITFNLHLIYIFFNFFKLQKKQKIY